LARALTAVALSTGYAYGAEVAQPYFAEATDLTRALGDWWRLSQILSFRHLWLSSAAIRSRRARRPKKAANSLTALVTVSPRGSVAKAWGTRC
jgi:hypothetical protein